MKMQIGYLVDPYENTIALPLIAKGAFRVPRSSLMSTCSFIKRLSFNCTQVPKPEREKERERERERERCSLCAEMHSRKTTAKTVKIPAFCSDPPSNQQDGGRWVKGSANVQDSLSSLEIEKWVDYKNGLIHAIYSP